MLFSQNDFQILEFSTGTCTYPGNTNTREPGGGSSYRRLQDCTNAQVLREKSDTAPEGWRHRESSRSLARNVTETIARLLVPGNTTTTGSLDLDYMGFLIIGSENHSLSSQHSSKNNEDYDQTLILGSPLANAQEMLPTVQLEVSSDQRGATANTAQASGHKTLRSSRSKVLLALDQEFPSSEELQVSSEQFTNLDDACLSDEEDPCNQDSMGLKSPLAPKRSPEKGGFQSLSWVLTDCQLVQRQPTGAETFPGPVCCRLVDPKHLELIESVPRKIGLVPKCSTEYAWHLQG
ncbi:hypothetical protein U0070_025405, partial [Myodes glareolus]